jgi:predicted AAA+ superfamily ATPase
MIPRRLQNIISSRLSDFPAVALLGPRQSGKTTLAKTYSNRYYDLELETEQLRVDLQWGDLIQTNELIILDEAQSYPDIFPKIRSAVDLKRKKNGRFLILGSVSPGLMKQVSEFLTGRIAICELSPFFLQEVGRVAADDLWLMGGFPDGGILRKEKYPVWHKNYIELLAMRDLPVWGLPALPPVTMRLFRMLAASNGSIWNASMIGKSMGLSYKTVNSYLNYLVQAYLVRKIEPYHTNIKKRLVKSPKVFLRDTGLLHTLMGINSFDDLIVQPWVGLSWEGWVIEQILNCLAAHDIPHETYHFRTIDGYELDLLLIINGEKWAFEIKLTSAPGIGELDRLKKASSMIGAGKSVLVSRTREPVAGSDIISTNINGILEILSEMK